MSEYIKFPKIIYHATLLQHLDSIKERILIHRQDAQINLDFGKGFYTTTSYAQALERAQYLQERERNPNSKALKREHRGIIISFELDSSLLYTVSQEERKVFESQSEEWADYIVYNRYKRVAETPHEFKWTFGSLADGKSIGYICKQYCNQEITADQLINGYEKDGNVFKGIVPYSEGYDQLSFHEDEDLVNSVLKYREFVIIEQQPKIARKRW